MTTEIEDLLNSAADDSDRPLPYTIDEIVVRGRRSARNHRIAAVATASLTTAAILGGLAAWSASRPQTAGPAATPPPRAGAVLSDTKPAITLTVDPATGKKIAPATPVSPLSDDQVRERCRGWEHEIETEPAYQPKEPPSSTGDPGQVQGKDRGPTAEQLKEQEEAEAASKAPGPITDAWTVPLKTGTGDALTAVILSPDKTVAVTCHMTKPTTKGGENDYGRDVVGKDRKFRDSFDWNQLPPGVSQVVVDLPKQGPTHALVSGGFYTWGVTGGNDDIQNVRIRGYDADGKVVFDQKQLIDAS